MNNIMCVYKSWFDNFKTNELITGTNALEILENIIKCHQFRERQVLEINPEFRQPIPYILLRRSNRFLLTQRTAKQNESRLHNKYALGIGGHIEENEGVIVAAERELYEETGFKGEEIDLTFQGIIIETGNPVAEVHVGIFFTADAPSLNLYLDEDEADLHRHSWVTKEELKQYQENFEGWAKIVYRDYILEL